MQPHTKLEVYVGLFVIAGGLALAYLAISLGGFELGRQRYELEARFSSVGDLKRGDPVKLAGVTVGEVGRIQLVDFVAQVQLSVDQSLALPEDTMASIQTAGLLGDAFVSLSPGAADQNLRAGASIRRTEPAISIMDLIAKYAFGERAGAAETTSGGASSAGDDLFAPASNSKPRP